MYSNHIPKHYASAYESASALINRNLSRVDINKIITDFLDRTLPFKMGGLRNKFVSDYQQYAIQTSEDGRICNQYVIDGDIRFQYTKVYGTTEVESLYILVSNNLATRMIAQLRQESLYEYMGGSENTFIAKVIDYKASAKIADKFSPIYKGPDDVGSQRLQHDISLTFRGSSDPIGKSLGLSHIKIAFPKRNNSQSAIVITVANSFNHICSHRKLIVKHFEDFYRINDIPVDINLNGDSLSINIKEERLTEEAKIFDSIIESELLPTLDSMMRLPIRWEPRYSHSPDGKGYSYDQFLHAKAWMDSLRTQFLKEFTMQSQDMLDACFSCGIQSIRYSVGHKYICNVGLI